MKHCSKAEFDALHVFNFGYNMLDSKLLKIHPDYVNREINYEALPDGIKLYGYSMGFNEDTQTYEIDWDTRGCFCSNDFMMLRNELKRAIEECNVDLHAELHVTSYFNGNEMTDSFDCFKK